MDARAYLMTSGASQHAVPMPWVMVLLLPARAALALPQSPILATMLLPSACTKMLCDLRSLWMMAGLFL